MGRASDEIPVEVVHDLKSPLAVILLEVDVLAHRLGDVPPEIRRSLERIERNVEYLDRIVRDLLDTSAFEAGKVELRREPVDLAQLVAVVLERRPLAERSRIQLEVGTPAIADIDALRIERVICNLVDNALKFSPPRSAISIRVDGSARASIAVTDAGPGLTHEQLQTLFEKHRRGRAAAGREGVGIGLYASRRIVEAHGGRVFASSVPGRGARFVVELPALHEEASPGPEPPRALRGKRVLLVDDEVAQLEALSDLLGEEGAIVTTACTGDAALDRLVHEPFDAVLLDIQMPGLSGFDVLAFVRVRWPRLPVVLVTAFSADEPAVVDALDPPCTTYVGKPIDLAELLALLAAVV